MGEIYKISSYCGTESRNPLYHTLGRVENTYFFPDEETVSFQFMDMNKDSSYRLMENTEAEEIALQKDEYFGKDTTLLYRNDIRVALLQRNRGGMAEGAIKHYLLTLHNFEENIIDIKFEPISDPFDLKPNYDNVRKLEISLNNSFGQMSTEDISAKKMNKIIPQLLSLKSKGALQIQISQGNDKESLDMAGITNIINSLPEVKDLKSAKIRVQRVNELAATYDLLQGIKERILSVNLDTGRTIGWEYLKDKMYQIFGQDIGFFQN